jgi:uncharacterized membrane protein
MIFLRAFFALSVLGCTAAMAHDHADRRFRAEEIAAPAELGSRCLAGFQKSVVAISLNDFGVVLAAANCVSRFDASAPTYEYTNASFVSATRFGSFALPLSSDAAEAWASNINNLGAVFGGEFASTGLVATKWSLAGGRERIFDDPTCDLRLSYASAGNSRYTIGWAFRRHEFLPDNCYTSVWLMRSAAGVETELPVTGTPAHINALNMVVGTSGNSAIRYDISTAQLHVLHEGDELHLFEPSRINDRGEVVGRSATISPDGGQFTCAPSVALRWDAVGAEHQLPDLPGAVSSRAWDVGESGDVVGDSGAGAYCPFTEDAQEHATLWRGDRPIDLNTLIPSSLGITLINAVGINRRGQIAATGIIDAEPAQKCPAFTVDGDVTILGTRSCPAMHVFLLTPAGR